MEIQEPNKFGRLNEVVLEAFESANGLNLPRDYRDFLLRFNGGKPVPNKVEICGSDVQWIYAMADGPDWGSFFYAVEVFQKRIPSWYIPIANDSGGSLYLMSLFEENKGTIAFWRLDEETSGDADQYFDNMSFVSSSFTEFLELLS